MKIYKFGVIGAGSITHKYLDVLSHLKNVRVEAISSRTLSKAKALSIKFKINNFYSQNEKLISQHKLDGIIILV